MFKNIQQKLLLNHPLLWNSKVIVFATLALFFHIIFFLLGFSKGEIDFTDSNDYYSYGTDSFTTISVSVLITILMFIIWLVYYSRNNAFKSFYPKNKLSLFKEWLLILLFCTLNATYAVSFFYAKDLRARNYYSEEEISKRLETITLSSLFVEGAFEESNFTIEEINGKSVRIERDSFKYVNRNYSLKSLLNKQMRSFNYFTGLKDSLIELKAKRWLVENKKDSVQWLFGEFFKLSKEHNLTSNITPEKWTELIYDYPEFTKYITVGRAHTENDPIYNYYDGVDNNYDYAVETVDSPENAAIDTLSKTIKIVNGQEFVYSKYYVPYNALAKSYGKISNAYENPDVDFDFILSFIYLSIGLSLAVFSFKVTSGKNWLIAFVSLGVVGIITGIFSVIIGGSVTFPIICMLVFLSLLLHFVIILKIKESKGISGITLNQILWIMPGFIPLLYFLVFEIIKETSGYNDYVYIYNSKAKQFPQVEWMEQHFHDAITLNILFVFIFLLIISIQIKKWKGIAEA
ncbi:hypothetical protein GGR22_002281 [Flavobacterium gossypii]|uniref:ABC transporter permease n=1 Tax=Flavobacterium gossypii TaxID=1646119 RepID=A0ABR6DRQ4_9FLAO|nr:hypothetical protein [Flavobacterium gossypii]MBA9074114.1 hypothetical protein [Flavobacterium gossypii]